MRIFTFKQPYLIGLHTEFEFYFKCTKIFMKKTVILKKL